MAEREAYIRSACSGDESLQHEVTDVLAWEERMGGFLQQPVAVIASEDSPNAAVAPAVQFLAGLKVGQYRIESKLGEGGMSTVWLAFDTRLAVRSRSRFSPTALPTGRPAAVFSVVRERWDKPASGDNRTGRKYPPRTALKGRNARRILQPAEDYL